MSLKQQLESLFLLDTVKPQASCCPSIDESLEALTRRWRLCEAADSYLRTCIPNRRVELSVHALFDAKTIVDVSTDYFAPVCKQGFLAIAHFDWGGDTLFLHLEGGSVHLLSFGQLSGNQLFHCDSPDLPITAQNVMKISKSSWPDPKSFLIAFRVAAESAIAEQLWDSVLGGLVPSEFVVPDEEYVAQLLAILATPLDTTQVLDGDGRNLLAVAKEMGRKSTIPILEEYWTDSQAFRERHRE
jgi:hypothetical protein